MSSPRTLGAALLLGAAWVAPLTAAAQEPAPAPAPPPPDAQPAPAAPPPAEPAPAAQPAPAPPPAPAPGNFTLSTSTNASTPTGADQAESEDDKESEEARKPGAAWVPWRGSAFNWSHDVTTTAVGVGRDNIGSEGETYSQGFGFTLNYFVIDEKDFRLRLTTSVGFDVELTDGGTTTTNEPQFRDLPLTIATGGLTLAQSEDKAWALGFIPNFTVIFPTSPIAHDRGVYVTTSPRLLTFFTAPILGPEAEHLQGVFGGVSLRWDHTFSRTTTPTNSDVARPRRDPTGSTFISDQISGNRIWDNRLRIGTFLFFEEVFGDATFWLSGGPSWGIDFLPEFDDVACVQIETGCAPVATNPDAPSTRISAGFGASFSVFPMAEWGVDIGYSNNTLQLGEDGQRRDIFYSPDSTFNASLIVSIDAIYERMVGPKRNSPVVIFGKNKTPAPLQPGQNGGPSLAGQPAADPIVF